MASSCEGTAVDIIVVLAHLDANTWSNFYPGGFTWCSNTNIWKLFLKPFFFCFLNEVHLLLEKVPLKVLCSAGEAINFFFFFFLHLLLLIVLFTKTNNRKQCGPHRYVKHSPYTLTISQNITQRYTDQSNTNAFCKICFFLSYSDKQTQDRSHRCKLSCPNKYSYLH